jgi:hypothetical protein
MARRGKFACNLNVLWNYHIPNFIDNMRHHNPHIHVKFQDNEAIISIANGELLEGEIPRSKMRLVLPWIEIHRDELTADWQLAKAFTEAPSAGEAARTSGVIGKS